MFSIALLLGSSISHLQLCAPPELEKFVHDGPSQPFFVLVLNGHPQSLEDPGGLFRRQRKDLGSTTGAVLDGVPGSRVNQREQRAVRACKLVEKPNHCVLRVAESSFEGSQSALDLHLPLPDCGGGGSEFLDKDRECLFVGCHGDCV